MKARKNTNHEKAALFKSEELEKAALLFKLLSDPTRLRILQALCKEERNVGDIVDATGASQANVSKHLALLTVHNVTSRRRNGLQIFYRVCEPLILELCQTVKNRPYQRRRQSTPVGMLEL